MKLTQNKSLEKYKLAQTLKKQISQPKIWTSLEKNK